LQHTRYDRALTTGYFTDGITADDLLLMRIQNLLLWLIAAPVYGVMQGPRVIGKGDFRLVAWRLLLSLLDSVSMLRLLAQLGGCIHRSAGIGDRSRSTAMGISVVQAFLDP
jgi:hypothetical protein